MTAYRVPHAVADTMTSYTESQQDGGVMTVALSSYQEVARAFLVSHRKFACLLDEPGVGKTFPAIAAAWNLKQPDMPVLITAPAYLLQNWKYEISRLVPNATVVLANSPGKDYRHMDLQCDVDFVLTSYNNWSAKVTDKDDPCYKDYEYFELSHKRWSAMIFDEGHRLRGRNSACTKHVLKTRLAKSHNLDTPIWVLSGTPFVRDGGDFFTFFHLYDKKKYGSYWKFVDDRCITQETPFGKKVGNIRRSYREEFSEELGQFSLRRTVADIPELQDLESVTRDYFVDMPTSVVKMIQKAKKEYVLEHEEMESSLVSGPGALYQVQRRMATNPPTKVKPKIDWLQDFLQDHTGKVVVYVWYKDSAKLVADSLGDRAVLITGEIPTSRRASVVDSWRSGDADILVATISSLKEGISLTESRHVVFLEASELPADMEQCEKRLLRRGQTKLVQVHRVWGNRTVDKAIKRVLDDRTIGLQEALTQWVKEEEDGGASGDGWF